MTPESISDDDAKRLEKPLHLRPGSGAAAAEPGFSIASVNALVTPTVIASRRTQPATTGASGQSEAVSLRQDFEKLCDRICRTHSPTRAPVQDHPRHSCSHHPPRVSSDIRHAFTSQKMTFSLAVAFLVGVQSGMLVDTSWTENLPTALGWRAAHPGMTVDELLTAMKGEAQREKDEKYTDGTI